MSELLPMRDGFRAVIDGWEQDDLGDIDGRIRQAVLWLRDNQPPQEGEAAAVSAIIEAGVTRTSRQIVDGYLRRAGISPDG